jgi:HSP20 family protein
MTDFERTFEEMNRLFDFFDQPLGLRSMPRGTFPAINVYDTENELVLTAEIPGVEAKDLDIQVLENSITLSGKRNGHQDNVRYYRRERVSGSFTRTLTLSDKVDPDKVSAEYKNGILTVHMPKARESKPRSIKIKAK